MPVWLSLGGLSIHDPFFQDKVFKSIEEKMCGNPKKGHLHAQETEVNVKNTMQTFFCIQTKLEKR